jgi:hypothetical protein
MIIQGINQYQKLEARFKASKEKQNTGSGKVMPKDTFEPTRKKPEVRQDLINTVKNKIRLGYYSSETVLDDLSNSFAKALNTAR